MIAELESMSTQELKIRRSVYKAEAERLTQFRIGLLKDNSDSGATCRMIREILNPIVALYEKAEKDCLSQIAERVEE